MTSTPRPAPPRMPTPPARVAGVALAAGLGLVALMTGRKPLHAAGRTWGAELRIDVPKPDLGVRCSGSGRPPVHRQGVASGRHTRRVVDIGGLALRLPGAGALGCPADLLFATTGTGHVSRHVLRSVRRAAGRPLTTLLPTRAGDHSVAPLLRPVDDATVPQEFAGHRRRPRCRTWACCLPAGAVRRHDAVLDPIVDEAEGTHRAGLGRGRAGARLPLVALAQPSCTSPRPADRPRCA